MKDDSGRIHDSPETRAEPFTRGSCNVVENSADVRRFTARTNSQTPLGDDFSRDHGERAATDRRTLGR
jgi:hypothetical protein